MAFGRTFEGSPRAQHHALALGERPGRPEERRALSLNNNVLRFKKDVDHAVTQKTIKEADAARVMTWYRLFTGFKGKSLIGNPEIAAALREHTQAL